MSDPKPASVIDAEELVRRIKEAKAMRAEGRPEEDIVRVEPSRDEIRQALRNLRRSRESINTGAKSKASSKRKKQPKSLDDLLNTDF